MKHIPPEITKIIFHHVAKHEDDISRQDLRNLRLVNNYFSQFATPLLFQTVPFWLGLCSLERLTLISEHPQISQYVTKLVFSTLRFVKWENPSSYQNSVRDRLERDTFSHNVFSLSFGKHVAAYRGYLEAQDYLSKKSLDIRILVRALRRLPQLKSLSVAFESEIIGAREIMSAFGLLTGEEVTFDSEYTLPVLIKALIESERELETFSLVSDESTSLYCASRGWFSYKHALRFKFFSGFPARVTAKAFENAFQVENAEIEHNATLRNLREFNITGLEIENPDVHALTQWSRSLSPIISFATGLEELHIVPAIVATRQGNDQRLSLSSILHGSTCYRSLRHLSLQHFESPEHLLVSLFTSCSCSLIGVELLELRITGNGSWSSVLQKSRTADFKVLKEFILSGCGRISSDIFAQHYLRRITDKDPIAEYYENNSDDLD